jgi:hypothetical protein
MVTPRSLLVLLALLAAGCMTVPARYRQPLQVYQPRVDRLAVAGFQRTDFVQTGGFSGAVGGNQVFGRVSGWSGDYRTFSDATMVRWFLEETRCARQVNESQEAPLRVEGEAHGEDADGALEWTAAIVESVTLLTFLGLPAPGRTEGVAVARLYRDGEFLRQLTSSARLHYWTTLYTVGRDVSAAKGLARTMALRDLADQVAADLCGAHRVAVAR